MLASGLGFEWNFYGFAVTALAGALLSLGTARLLEGQLYGVPAHDPTTLAAVGAPRSELR